MTSLGLDPISNSSSEALVLELHNIENTLSHLMALIFWIGESSPSNFHIFGVVHDKLGGHVQPDALTMNNSNNFVDIYDSTSNDTSTYRPRTPPVLVAGNTTIQQDISLVRLNVRIGLIIKGYSLSYKSR
jgi:hypothetical protein